MPWSKARMSARRRVSVGGRSCSSSGHVSFNVITHGVMPYLHSCHPLMHRGLPDSMLARLLQVHGGLLQLSKDQPPLCAGNGLHGEDEVAADLEGSAAGGCFSQRRRLEPSGICATSSTSHLPPSFRPFTALLSFSTTPDTCTTWRDDD